MKSANETHHRSPVWQRVLQLANSWLWLPLPVFLGAMMVFWALGLTESYESTQLFIALNLIFTFSVSVFASELARRCFLERGTPELLLFDCGALFWGGSGLCAAVLVPLGPNAFITVHNTLIWFSAACFLVSAILSLLPTRKLERTGLWLAAAYSSVLLAAALCISFTLTGDMPTFFIPGLGGTLLRQFVLISTIAMFGFTSAVLLTWGHRSSSRFFRWHGLGLALIACGLWGVMLQLTSGSLLGWTGRIAQYLGSIYILAAMLGVLGETRANRLPLERSLREREAQIDAVFDVALVGVVQADPRDGRFLRFNPWFCELTGYSAEELRHMRFPELTHPDDRQSEWEVFSRAAAGESKGYHNDKRYVRKDGSVIWVSVNLTFIRNEAGRSIRTFAICEDITERRLAEAALRESELRFRLALRHAPVSVSAQDRDLRYVWAFNQRSARPEEIIGKLDADIFTPEEAARLAVIKRRVIEENIEVREQMWLDRPTGRMFLDVSFEPIRDEAGRTIGVGTATIDLTPMKKTEEELFSANQRLTALMNALPVGVSFSEDASCQRIRGNPAFLKQIEAGPSDDISASAPDPDASGRRIRFFRNGQPLTAADLPLQRAVAENREIPPMELEIHLPSGRCLFLESTGAPVRDLAGQVIGAVVVTEDITERKRAEDTLRESEEKYRSFFEGSLDAVLLTSPDGSYLAANKAAQEMFGMTEEEIIASHRSERVDTSDLRLASWLEERARTGKARSKIRLRRKDGSIFPGEAASTIFTGASGQPRTALVLRDITDSERKEQELLRARDRLQSTLNSLNEGYYALDDSWRFVEANPVAETHFGRPRGELVGRSIWEITGANPDGLLYKNFVQAKDGKKAIHFEAQSAIRPDYWAEMHLYPRDDLLEVYFSDISERKRLEEELRQNEQQYRELVQNANSAIIRWKSDGTIIFFNEYAQEFFGYRTEEVIGQPVTLLVPEAESNGTDLTGLAQSIVEHPERFINNINENIRRDGSRVWMTWTNKPILGQDGKVKEIFAVGSDITELRRAQEALIQAREAAETANQAKSTFLANMSHEIRTPMNGVLGMTDLALMKNTEPQVREYLGYVKESGLHLLDIINDVLDLSRIEAGKAALCRAPFSLKELLTSTLEPLRSAFADKNIHLSSDIDPVVPDRLMGDSGRLRQVLTNLIGNALKFTENGEVSISVGSNGSDRPQTGMRMLFGVRDTGIGIPPGSLETIFNSFEQVHTSLHPKYGGSGLGLTICKSLVEMMGGKIWVESREGVGSTFFFTAVLDVAPMANIELGTAGKTAQVVRPLNILVAEDTRVNQVFLEAILKKDGHRVAIVETGRQALEKLAEDCFDIVLMDIRMPDLSGDEAVRLIRKNPPPSVNPRIPVVALTAYALETERERFMESGFDAYLTKPVEIAKLRAILAELG